jgi:glutathione synthase/RimK-type ligase-like ATP-grasp enzyme
MILILTRKNDDHTFFVTERLKQNGAPFICLETADFPQSVSATLAYNIFEESRVLSINGIELNLGDIRTVWNRRPMAPVPNSSLSELDYSFAKQESSYFLSSLWRMLPHAFWVNPYSENINADHKPYQLQLAQSHGFKIPRTLITNSPDRLIEFRDSCAGGMIYKCLTSHGRILDDGRGRALYTAPVNHKDLTEHLDQINVCPCIFQEYIEKKVELRVTVFGRRIFAIEIDSQSHDFSKIDWRRPDGEHRNSYHIPQRLVDLPADVKDKIFRYMDRLGLVFACWDFIVTPQDELVFLEVNPNGQWYWLEQVTGAPMLDAFTQMLVAGTALDDCSEFSGAPIYLRQPSR